MSVLVDGEIVLYGEVGDDFWGDGFTDRDVLEALAAIGRATDVTVRINSGGGDAIQGVAIFNAFRAHRGKVSVVVDAIAASAASLIAMGGSTVTMRTGAIMMIHNPSAFTAGGIEDHQRSIAALETVTAQMADVYAEKTGRPVADIRADMAAETWLTAAEAVEKGYADASDAAASGETSAYAYRLYARAPESLVALADARGWKPRAATPATTEKEKTMSGTPAAADKTATAAEVAAATAAATQAAATAAAEIATLCAAGGVPAMAASLIARGATADQAKAAIAGAKDIRAAVDNARRLCPQIEAAEADRFIAAGTSIETVRAEMFDRMTAAQSVDIRATHQAAGQQPPGAAGKGIDAGAIYAAHNKGFGGR